MSRKPNQVSDSAQESIVEETIDVKKTTEKVPKAKTTSKKTKSDTAKKATKSTKASKEVVTEIIKIVTPQVFFQYAGNELDAHTIIDQVKTNWLNAGHEENIIESIRVYIKPEENAAYYVINETETGKIDL